MLLITIFFLFSFIAIVPSLLLYFILKIWKRGAFLKWYFWTPTLLIVTGLSCLTFLVNKQFINAYETQLGWVVILYFILVIPRIIYLFVLLVTSPFRLFKRRIGKPIFYVALSLTLFSEFIIIYGVLAGRNNFEVKQFTYESEILPRAFDGYKIAQLSDIHIGSWIGNSEALEELIYKTNELNADLIVFTGDLVNHRTKELKGFESILSKLKAKDGVYSILGNHDYGTYYRYWKDKAALEDNLKELLLRQKKMGWKMLNNEHVFIKKGNDSIALIGVENDGEPPFSQYADLKKATKGTEGLFQILLSHNPTHWRREVLPESDIELMLAGHTHAMQLKLFGFSPAKFRYKEWGGAYYQKNSNRCLYVNIGAGAVGIPFRFGAWPEITLITLKRKI